MKVENRVEKVPSFKKELVSSPESPRKELSTEMDKLQLCKYLYPIIKINRPTFVNCVNIIKL